MKKTFEFSEEEAITIRTALEHMEKRHMRIASQALKRSKVLPSACPGFQKNMRQAIKYQNLLIAFK